MDILEIMKERHSVRQYKNQVIEPSKREEISAPTAVNQQKFLFELKNGKVTAKNLGGFYSKIDLGIVKYYFEAVTEHEVK